MASERILALDMSTKTGWACMILDGQNVNLVEFGQNIPIPETIGIYPENYVLWAHACYDAIITLIDKFKPDVLVIEETASTANQFIRKKY